MIAHHQGQLPAVPPGATTGGERRRGDCLKHLELFHHVTQGGFLFIDRDAVSTDRLMSTALSIAFANLNPEKMVDLAVLHRPVTLITLAPIMGSRSGYIATCGWLDKLENT
ncbi:hypothetical protein GGS24DRAFT_480138 [Hypoxylon argillaceum]|nr:hypothetical protein GGS24DRAFT_480138 [Hypoxylon argillaceum]